MSWRTLAEGRLQPVEKGKPRKNLGSEYELEGLNLIRGMVEDEEPAKDMR